MYGKIELPGMCNWCIEEEKGWFVAYSVNTLFQYDMRTKILSAVSSIPVKKAGTFQNPLCVKYENRIYCLPHYQNSIWYYDLTSGQWAEIVLCKDKNTSVLAGFLGRQEDKYYFFSMALKKIWELNLKTARITASYDIRIEEQSDIHYCCDGILVKDSIYLVFGGSAVYEFHLKDHSQKRYELPEVDDTLYKIGYDGESFWLIGKKKNVYQWEQKSNTVQILTQFPDDFAIYDFAKKIKTTDFKSHERELFVFNKIFCLEDRVWLIPQSANKIIYYDRNDRRMQGFDIQDEEETAETLDLHYRHIASKFFMMYVREERYLGIYSYQNKRMFEIDTQYMKYKNIDVMMDDKSLFNIEIQNLYEDGNESTYLIYHAKMGNRKVEANDCDDRSVGSRIYAKIKEEI